MSYNLQSLVTIIQKILYPEQPRWTVDHNKSQLESLLEKAESLQSILGNSSLIKIESLEDQIRDAVYKAEDIIESHMVDQMLSTPGGVSLTFSTPDLQQVTQDLGSVMEQVVKLMKGKMSGAQELESLKLVEAEEKKMLTGSSWSSKSVVVGVDEDLLRLKDRLIGMQRKLEIVSIVGMGGVGKTTLARKLYEDELIVSWFDYRGWTTISQDYNMKAILLGLLHCIIGKEADQHSKKENNELKDVLYRSLYRRKYMIVLDDIWSTKFWEEIRRYFPENDNGSRIVITTRESNVAKHLDSRNLLHQVQLLSNSQSWNLLRQIVFGDEDCPHPLQGIGAKIASDCGGLPLAINVIGGLLSKVERSQDVWENIANDVRAAIAESDDEQFSDILSLSYNHLPNHLKPCFLYMGAFCKDYGIKAPKLTRLLVAEGFVKSNGYKNLEEGAEDCLKALVERNLLLVKQKKYNGKPKSYNIHNLLRDLCMRKAEEEKFMYMKYSPKLAFSNQRRVSVHESYASAELMSLARSFLCTGGGVRSSFFSALRLLRVLDVMDRTFRGFPTDFLKLVNLRYLAIRSSLPSEISRLCNLQTLIASIEGYVPSEIWELPELRHLKLNGIMRFKRKQLKRIALLEKLQTTSMITLTPKLIEVGFFESIPNIRKLEIYIPILPSNALDLSHLHKLEALRCVCGFDGGVGYDSLSMPIFPSSLRKLTLENFELFPRMLSALCGLPNLEMLDLNSCDFEKEAEKDEECEAAEEEWEVAEGDEFRSLQFLSLAYMSLKRWRADETNFPRLRHLTIISCHELEEIPYGIGEIPTLQLIELEDCKDPLADSAKQILEVQQVEYDNYDLQLRISNY